MGLIFIGTFSRLLTRTSDGMYDKAIFERPARMNDTNVTMT